MLRILENIKELNNLFIVISNLWVIKQWFSNKISKNKNYHADKTLLIANTTPSICQ